MSSPPLNPESTALSLENLGTSTTKGSDIPFATIPTIVISQSDPPSDQPEKAETEKEPHPADENCSRDKTEDSDHPLASHFKMIFKGLSRSRSQELLVSTKSTGDEEPLYSDPTPRCIQNGGLQGERAEGPSWRHFSALSNKKEKMPFKLSCGANKTKGKDHGSLPRGEDSHYQKSQVNWEQLEATKAIFDLLKEISGLFSEGTVHNIKELQGDTSVLI